MPLRVVLVEDDRDLSRSLRDVLEGWGCDVATVASPREVIAALELHASSTLIVDLWNAADLLEIVRANPNTARLPVVALRERADEPAVGADFVLTKPFTVDDLERAIGELARFG